MNLFYQNGLTRCVEIDVGGETGTDIFIERRRKKMPWFDTNKWTPRDGEKILFHCKNWYRKSMWEIGRYCKAENRVYNHYVGRVYEFYDWNDVDYWYKVPAIQTGKKKIAEEMAG